jgi:hypothetical protein
MDGVERIELKSLTYKEWCRKERLPMDRYRHWKRSLPKLQSIIDDIADGYFESAYRKLGSFITAFRPERFLR